MYRVSRRKQSRGFTIVEMLVAATIAALLAAAGMVSFTTANRNARNARRQSDLEQFRAAMELYRTENGSYLSGTGDLSGSFDSAVSSLFSGGFITNQSLSDPKNNGNYVYTYNAGVSGYTTCPGVKAYELCARLEPGETTYCLCNP